MRTVLWATVVVVAGGLVLAAVYGARAERFDLERVGTMPQRSEVLDRRGRLVGRLHGENRVLVRLDQVSEHFVKALLAREDSRFYGHGGVDWYGVARSVVRNVQRREIVQGASTLTMQLARNSFAMQEKSMDRKLLEAALALRIEREFSKEEILELYMNRVFFGGGLYGVERASQSYFGKPAALLELGEAAMLAGILRSPNRFHPQRNYEGAVRERNTVLERMVKLGMISEEEAEAARAEEEVIRARRVYPAQEGYLMDMVRRELDTIALGSGVEDGGLRILTTVDLQLQSRVEVSFEEGLAAVEAMPGYGHQRWGGAGTGTAEGGETSYLQGAAVVLDNMTGGILAVVGGRDHEHSQFNRAMQARRTAGSTFKAVVYAAAFEQGALLPGSWIDDRPLDPYEVQRNEGGWSPRNADGSYQGTITVEQALARSRNTTAVRAGGLAGLDNVADLARRMGLEVEDEPGPQICLGNLGVTPMEMATAFASIANLGLRREAHLIWRIEDASGRLLYRAPEEGERAFVAGVGELTDRCLRAALAPGGTGASARTAHGFTGEGAGKTGTTDDYADAWFAGYTPALTGVVWMGFDRPQRVIDRGYGGRLALPVWCELMAAARQEGYAELEVPRAGLVKAPCRLCRVSGFLATDSCEAHGAAYGDELPYDVMPSGFCLAHRGAPSRAEVPGYAGGGPRAEEPAAPRDEGGGLWRRVRGWFR